MSSPNEMVQMVGEVEDDDVPRLLTERKKCYHRCYYGRVAVFACILMIGLIIGAACATLISWHLFTKSNDENSTPVEAFRDFEDLVGKDVNTSDIYTEAHLLSIFEKLDQDGDGLLNGTEILLWVQAQRIETNDFDMYDVDPKNGFISPHECGKDVLVAYGVKTTDENLNELSEQCFQDIIYLDQDGDGMLSRHEHEDLVDSVNLYLVQHQNATTPASNSHAVTFTQFKELFQDAVTQMENMDDLDSTNDEVNKRRLSTRRWYCSWVYRYYCYTYYPYNCYWRYVYYCRWVYW